MADSKQAVDFVLHQEDAKLSGVITNIPADRGGLTRYGLVAKYHMALAKQGFYSASMPASVALPLAIQAYETDYEGPLCLDQINSQSVATAYLSCAVNEGMKQATQLLQRACGVADDGVLGPKTLAAVNAADPAILLAAYCEFERDYYRQIVADDTSQGRFLNGWLNRVQALSELKD